MMKHNQSPLVICQISDSHLFASENSRHCGVDVFANFKAVLRDIAMRSNIDYVVFTGDLTQDHSEKSYQNFVSAFSWAQITTPSLFVAGNHDEPTLLAKYLSKPPFSANKKIDHASWQVQLIHSKSNTPAGIIDKKALNSLKLAIDKNKKQLVMMHHHPINIGYFIDDHGLKNKSEFWHVINEYTNIQAIACGHVHRASKLATFSAGKYQSVDVYTCPATSIQFDPSKKTVAALAQQPGYRLFYLYPDGTMQTHIITV